MTMPHLMNCDHSGEGWCLACVKAEWEANATALRLAEKRIGSLVEAERERDRLIAYRIAERADGTFLIWGLNGLSSDRVHATREAAIDDIRHSAGLAPAGEAQP